MLGQILRVVKKPGSDWTGGPGGGQKIGAPGGWLGLLPGANARAGKFPRTHKIFLYPTM